jgi:hypothetical protein
MTARNGWTPVAYAWKKETLVLLVKAEQSAMGVPPKKLARFPSRIKNRE